MDIWEIEDSDGASEEGEDGLSAAVHHGHSSTSPLSVSSALATIRQYAFDFSTYPLIVRLEQHLNSLDEQRRLAAAIHLHLGDVLVDHDEWADWDPNYLPSPESLKGKILLSVSLQSPCSFFLFVHLQAKRFDLSVYCRNLVE